MKNTEERFRAPESRQGVKPINCNNDSEMVREGLRPPLMVKDKTIHSKSYSEIQVLKEAKRACVTPQVVYYSKRERIQTFVLYLVNNVTDNTKRKFFHTTRTYKVTKTDMDNIVESFADKNFKIKKLDLR